MRLFIQTPEKSLYFCVDLRILFSQSWSFLPEECPGLISPSQDDKNKEIHYFHLRKLESWSLFFFSGRQGAFPLSHFCFEGYLELPSTACARGKNQPLEDPGKSRMENLGLRMSFSEGRTQTLPGQAEFPLLISLMVT